MRARTRESSPRRQRRTDADARGGRRAGAAAPPPRPPRRWRWARRALSSPVRRARLAYCAAGSVVVDAARDTTRPLHVIQRGHVRSVDPSVPGQTTVLGPGECFPLASADAERADSAGFVATEDLFCYQIDAADCEALRARAAPFAEFCAQSLRALAHESNGQVRRQFSQRAVDQQTLLQPVGALLRRAPVSCEALTPLRLALERMSSEGI